MQPEKETDVKARQTGDREAVVACPSCRAPLVAGMRFCRMCGYRLGEGVEEFAETRHFSSGDIPFAQTGTADARQAHHNRPFTPGQWAPLASTGAQASTPDGARDASRSTFSKTCRRLSGNWMLWVILLIAVLTATGIVMRGVRRGGFGGAATVAAPVSFLGVDGFETAEGGTGAFIEGIAAPDTPVERAGLLGGDVITVFDGKPISDEDDMRRALRQTPPGKTVEVVFTRDGETKQTTLTTIAERDYQGTRALDSRPGGRGQFGISDLERVRVPNSNIYGVEIGDVDRNEPADLAGIREGDIVIQINEHLVRTAGDLRLRIYQAMPGSTATVVVMRGGERIEIPVKVGRSR